MSCEDTWGRASGWGEQPVRGPYGRRMSGMFKEHV